MLRKVSGFAQSTLHRSRLSTHALSQQRTTQFTASNSISTPHRLKSRPNQLSLLQTSRFSTHRRQQELYAWQNQHTQSNYVADSKYVQMRQDLDSQLRRGPIVIKPIPEKTKQMNIEEKKAKWKKRILRLRTALKWGAALVLIPLTLLSLRAYFNEREISSFYSGLTQRKGGVWRYLEELNIPLLRRSDTNSISTLSIFIDPVTAHYKVENPLELQPFIIKHFLIAQELEKRLIPAFRTLHQLKLYWSMTTAESLGISTNDFDAISAFLDYQISRVDIILQEETTLSKIVSWAYLKYAFLNEATVHTALCRRDDKDYTLEDFSRNEELFHQFFDPKSLSKTDLQYVLENGLPEEFSQHSAIVTILQYGTIVDEMKRLLRLSNAASLYLASQLSPDWREFTPPVLQHLYALFKYLDEAQAPIRNLPIDEFTTGMNLEARSTRSTLDQKLEMAAKAVAEAATPRAKAYLSQTPIEYFTVNSASLGPTDLLGLTPLPIYPIPVIRKFLGYEDERVPLSDDSTWEYLDNIWFRIQHGLGLLSAAEMLGLVEYDSEGKKTEPTIPAPSLVLDITKLRPPNKFNYNQEFPPILAEFAGQAVFTELPSFFMHHVPFKPLPILPLPDYVTMRLNQRQRAAERPTLAAARSPPSKHGSTPVPTSPGNQAQQIISQQQRQNGY